MPLNNPTNVTEVTVGSYSGNNTANRGIPHGMTKGYPYLVIIFDVTNKNRVFFRQTNWGELVFLVTGGTISTYTVTGSDATNFYVGNAGSLADSANNTGASYYWVAIR